MPLQSDRFHRHFLPWDRPWLTQVAAWLARDWRGDGPLDLSRTMAVVPTRQSARRLREALAECAARRGAAVFPPRAHTPDSLLALGGEAEPVATRLESLLAWTEVLRQVDLASVPDVFPVPPPHRDFGWAWRLAENLFRLQIQLADGGLDFTAVAETPGDLFPERERWRQLAALERQQADMLAGGGLREPQAVRREFARAPARPPGIDRIVVLAVPDPLPLAVAVLDAWAEWLPVDVVVFAPPSEAGAFDFMGRPLPAVWERRMFALTNFEQAVQLCADPAAEAERMARVVRRYVEPDGLVALGLADAEVLPLLENELSRAGLAHYNPEGRARRSERLHALLSALAALAREPSFDAVAALARCPDFLICLRTRFGAGFSAAGFLKELDDLRAAHLPADLATARAMAEPEGRLLARGLDVMHELHGVLTEGAFPANAMAGLALIFKGRRFDLTQPGDARMTAAAETWREVMVACVAAREKFSGLQTPEWWEIALRIFGETRHTEEKPADALELQGWLELLWEDAPHLLVAGLNEGLVPEAIVGDPFLPESLREILGLKTNAARFARDAYLLQAIAASRAQGGRLELFFAKNSAVGDPLRPSRLLLRCDDAELPARIAFLFRAAEAVQPNLPWTRAWKLAPDWAAPPKRVPVTSLRQWLACPFRFYLRYVLKMESTDPLKSEMDAFDFGTLCHAALEAMAREPALRDCVDEKTLREFLLDRFDREARGRFGERLTLPLVIQLESARQRLGKVATIQARERAAGWLIERVEWPFAIDVAGLEVRGKIDRIDRHEASGAWRVLDYKTSDTAISPHRAHLRSFRPDDARLPAWARARVNAREMVWSDMQLPVYLRALGRELGDAEIGCGYINLPKATGETALNLWSELTPSLLAMAAQCTDGVAARILTGEFWPPAEIDPDYDSFASLFHHAAVESVDFPPNPNAPAARETPRQTTFAFAAEGNVETTRP